MMTIIKKTTTMGYTVLLCALLGLSSVPLCALADGDDRDGDISEGGFYSARDCHDHRTNGKTDNGKYPVYYKPKNATKTIKEYVYCEDMQRNSPFNTAFTVIQRRQSEDVSFEQNWEQYRIGFGNTDKDYWIGNELLHHLTNTGVRYILRIELKTMEPPFEERYAEYSSFSISAEASFYKLSYENYTGNAGDSLAFHRGMEFSTPDRDNDRWKDGNCASILYGGWWFNDCAASNLNGQFYNGTYKASSDIPYKGGIWWFGMGDMFTSFQCTMKIRPMFADYIARGIIA